MDKVTNAVLVNKIENLQVSFDRFTEDVKPQIKANTEFRIASEARDKLIKIGRAHV